jgi:pyruvate/2-oxoglutarate/acetoin dehydrogenase E1 component
MDFMFYAFDPIINQAANWYFMSGGKVPVPVVFWGIINRGGEQAAQHSQAIHALFSHVPGLKVLMPATAYDAKGLMIAAIRDPNPVVFVDDRWLYRSEEEVPEEIYEIEIGKGIIRRKGKDLTLVALSYMVQESVKAVDALEEEGIDIELIDLRTAKPLDQDLVLNSVKKTGRIVIADGGWKTCGLASEISAVVAERGFHYLKAPVERVTLPDQPAPASRRLEKTYYPTSEGIAKAIRKVLNEPDKRDELYKLKTWSTHEL